MMAFSFGAGGRVLLVIVHLLYIWIDCTLAQEDVTTELDGATADITTDPNDLLQSTPLTPNEGSEGADTDFIDPIMINPNVEAIGYKGREYLLVDIKVMHDFAEMMCPSYFSATLATIPNMEVADLLSDALAETNLEFESLWVGGKNSSLGTWNWIKNNYSEAINEEIINLIGNTDNSADLERNCLAFARKHHQKPQFKNLNCFVQRAFMCERPRGSSGANESTHGGWILIGSRLYKIFSDKVDYNTASINCFAANSNATLAVVDNAEVIKELGRYLLIGRPSLENAWIGARWINDRYEFEADSSIMLENTTNTTVGFPPWRENVMQKPFGCLLLDRHLTDTPLFVEARCQRLRAYICSKPTYDINTATNFTETQFEDRVYRAYFNPEPWAQAQKICLDDSGKLAEPEGKDETEELLYIMGQNISTFSHIWLGGRYLADQWVWDTTKTEIDQTLFPFVTNTTYIEHIEQMNTCLNMDRENHIVGIFYGTNCYYPQHYICRITQGIQKTL